MKTLTIGIVTKLQIHANTTLSILNVLKENKLEDYILDIKFLPGKSNIDQARSMIITEWYDKSNNKDLFLFLDSDQTFTIEDIRSLIKLNSDVACGVYSNLKGLPTCRPKNMEHFLKGDADDLYYGATGFMLIRRPILEKIEMLIKQENMGHSRFYISPDFQNTIPFFKQRLIVSETVSDSTGQSVPEWLGEDYGFCWMARHVGGTVKGLISSSIGHEVTQLMYFYPEIYKKKVWSDKSIVYYCGTSRFEWSPDDIVSKGLGGSETAVVYLAKYWAELGYEPTIYGNVKEGTYDGVQYLNSSKINRNDEFNVFIIWRAYGFDAIGLVRAKKILVDLHDCRSTQYETMLRQIGLIDKVLVKSYYHRSQFPQLLYDNFDVIPNGVADHFFESDNLNFNKYQIVYASSYDRGIIEILKWGWPIVKKRIPEAELHIYYGMELLGDKLKNELLPLLDQDGIFHHGKVSQIELKMAKERANIHYYVGCYFETDCISIKESALLDCIPVVTTNSVFAERDYVIKIKGNPRLEETHIFAANEIVRMIEDDNYREECSQQIKDNIGSIKKWQDVAKDWTKYFE